MSIFKVLQRMSLLRVDIESQIIVSGLRDAVEDVPYHHRTLIFCHNPQAGMPALRCGVVEMPKYLQHTDIKIFAAHGYFRAMYAFKFYESLFIIRPTTVC